MKLYRWREIGGEKEVVIFASTIPEAIDYLKTWPLFWHLNLAVEMFQEIEPPKGPSPSVLIYKLGNATNVD